MNYQLDSMTTFSPAPANPLFPGITAKPVDPLQGFKRAMNEQFRQKLEQAEWNAFHESLNRRQEQMNSLRKEVEALKQGREHLHREIADLREQQNQDRITIQALEEELSWAKDALNVESGTVDVQDERLVELERVNAALEQRCGEYFALLMHVLFPDDGEGNDNG